MNEVGQLIAELGGLGTITPASALILTVILIIRGSLTPRRHFDDMRKERDLWKDLALRRFQEQGSQIDAMIRSHAVTVAVAEAVQRAGESPAEVETDPGQ